MDINKYIKTYKKDTFSLITESVLLFSIIPLFYLIFYFFISENINSPEFFREPTWFKLNINLTYYLSLFKKISMIALIAIVVNSILILAINYYVKFDQKKLLNFYIPLYKLTWINLKVSVLLIILTLLISVFVIFNYLIPFFRPVILYVSLVGGLSIGCLVAFFLILDIIQKFDQKTALPIYGLQVGKKDQPELFSLVENCAKKIKSSIPDNIVIGSTDGFFVTSSDVLLYNYKDKSFLKGKTLYLSLISLKVLTKDELTGIIGHELAHFSGEDTDYTIKFNPIIYTLNEKLKSFDSSFKEAEEFEGGLPNLIASETQKFFLIMILNPIIYIFLNLYRKDKVICIQQELRADKIGSSLCKNKKSFIIGLCKFGIYSQLWAYIDYEIYKETTKKKSLSKVFDKEYKKYISNFNPKKDLRELLNYEMYHPSDTHPPTIKRAKNLKVDIKSISKADLTKIRPSASDFIKNFENLNYKLSGNN